MIVRILNFLIDIFVYVANFLLTMLPSSPFSWDIVVPEWARFIAVFIPFGAMASFMMVYVSAVSIYYAVRGALRWAKAVG